MYVLLFLSLEKKLGMTGCSSGTRCGDTTRVYSLYKTTSFLLLLLFFSFFFPKREPQPPCLLSSQIAQRHPTHFHQPPPLNRSTTSGDLHPNNTLPSPHHTQRHHGKTCSAPQSLVCTPQSSICALVGDIWVIGPRRHRRSTRRTVEDS